MIHPGACDIKVSEGMFFEFAKSLLSIAGMASENNGSGEDDL